MRHKKDIINNLDFFLSLQVGDTIYIDKRLIDIIKELKIALTYRRPALVFERKSLPTSVARFHVVSSVCPKCKAPLNRIYQMYCSNCGQHLVWLNLIKIKVASFRSKKGEKNNV